MAFLTKQTEYFKTTTTPNVGKVGSWSVFDNGIAADFKAGNYVLLPDEFDIAGGKTWEILLSIRTGSDVSTFQTLTGTNYYRYDPVALTISGGKFCFEICSNTGTSAWSSSGTHVVQPNTDYWVRAAFDGSTYSLDYSTDGEYFTRDITKASTVSSYTLPLILGCQSANSNGNIINPFLGSFYLDKCYIKIEDELWWNGKVFSFGGRWINNGVANGFTTANYLQVPWSFNAAVQKANWEIVGKFNMSTDGVFNPIFGGGSGTYIMDVAIGTTNKFMLRLSSNGSSYNIASSVEGTYVFEKGVDYWCKLSFDGSKYVLSYSFDGNFFTEDVVVESNLQLELTYDKLCIGFRVDNYFRGTIDLKESYIKIGESYWWYGVDLEEVNPKDITDFGETKYFKYVEGTLYWKYGTEPNVKFFGSPTVINSVVSGFSAGNYMEVTNSFDVSGGKTWEMDYKVTTGSNVTSYQSICGHESTSSNADPVTIVVTTASKFAISLCDSSSTGIIEDLAGSYSVQPNTTYYVKLAFTGSEYVFSYSLDGVDYVEDIRHTSSTPVWTSNLILGRQESSASSMYPWLGSIDLTESCIKIDGEDWWHGTKPVEINIDGTDVWANWKQPILTANGLMGGTSFAVNASSSHDGNYLPFNVFDANLTNEWEPVNSGGLPAFIGFYNPKELKVSKLMLTNGNQSYVTNCVVQGSNDYSEWVDIKEVTNSVGALESWYIDVNSDTGYKYHRLYITGTSNGNYCDIRVIDISAKELSKVGGTVEDAAYTTEETYPEEVPAGEPYDYSVTIPSDQYTYSQARNNGFELTRRKSFYYAYTDDLETLRTGDWGTLTADGLASGFDASDECLTLPQRVPMWSADTWEMVFKFKYVASTESFQSIWDAGGNYSLGLQIDPTGHVHLRGGNVTNANLFDIATTTAMVSGNIYYAKADFTGTAYNVYVSETDEFGEPEATYESTTKITERGYKNRLGAHQGDSLQYIFKGVLHLPESYINVDGNRFWDWKTSIVPDGHIMNNLLWGRDGIVSSDNVANNCLLLPEAAQPTGINWEVQVKITTGSDVSTEQCLIGDWIPYDGFLLQILSGKICFYASSNGTSWDLASDVRSTNSILANTTYYIKLSYDGVKYSIDVSTDGSIYDNYITLETDKLMYKGRYVACARYGGDRAFSVQFKGTMDLNESYMIIGDDIVWSGMKTLINPTYYFGLSGSWIKKDVDNGHIIGGRSGSGTYMRTSRPVFSTYEKDIEVCMKVMMGINPVAAGEIQYIMAPNYSTFIWGFNTDGRICRYNNSDWVYGTTYYMPGEWIWLKVKWDGAKYYTYTLKDDGYTKDTLPDVSEWKSTGTFANTTNIFSGYNLFLGWDDNKAARYFRGYIDYSDSYVKVDGKEIWTGTSIKEIPETEVTVDIEYYKEIRHQVNTLTYACYSTNNRYVYAKAPVGGYDTVYCYRGNDMSVQTTDASLLASSGYTFTGLTDDLATFNLVGDYSLPRYPDGDIYRTAISIETVPGTPDDYTYTKISENFGFTETRRVAAPLINVAATKRYYFRVILETDTPGEYSFTIPEGSEYTRVTIVGGGGACALRGVYDDRGYGWGGGSAGAYDGEFALTPGEYTATVASANNNTKSQGGNTNTLNPNDMTTHDSWIDGVVRIGGGGCGHYSPNYVGAAGASATFEMEPQNSRLNSVGRVGVYGSGGKGSSPAAYCAGGGSVYNGYGKGQGGYASEYANGRRWVNGTGGYLKVVSASLSPEGGYDYFEDILKG